jgi:tRNA (Thr-GGU) A37 N-methylase
MAITFQAIGKVGAENGFSVQLDPRWREGLSGLSGFSHLVVLWHADQGTWDDAWLTLAKPYRLAPDKLGIFATRSPLRPNPICQTIIGVSGLDLATGTIHCHYIDAAPGTPVLDIKPWLACCERPSAPAYPEWCTHWPQNLEASGGFDWENEFRF